MKRKLKLIIMSVIILALKLDAYNIPRINLGGSNILDGGPIRPNPGLYLIQNLSYYHSDFFTDHKGERLGSVQSPIFDAWGYTIQLAYQSERQSIIHGKWGLSATLPTILSSKITCNRLNISSSGSGFGNLIIGPYLQWDPIMINDRPLFVHRFEFDVAFPTGKTLQPFTSINPGNNFYYIDPYWAATLYFTKDWAISWRIHYLWCAQDKINCIKTGDAIHLNYSMEYQIIPKLFIGIVGYYLQQLKNNKLRGIDIPNSKTRIFSVGAGMAYFFPQEFTLLSYIYFERKAINSSQGIRAIARLVKHF